VESRNRQYQFRAELAARQHVEGELRRLDEELEQQVAERTAVAEQRALHLRRLTIQLSETEHRERARLARLLHDDLQQLLSAIKLHLYRLADARPGPLKEKAGTLIEWVEECLNVCRSLSHELSPSVLQYGTLREILEWLGVWFDEKHGLAVTIECEDDLPSLPEHLRLVLFQSVRELLMNVAKHSGNLEARLTLSSRAGRLTVEVADGGTGFAPAVVQDGLRRPRGFGLFQIQERLTALDGRLEIARTPRGGAIFRLVFPSPLAEGEVSARGSPGS
jgi:signal transduction histidine kinase